MISHHSVNISSSLTNHNRHHMMPLTGLPSTCPIHYRPGPTVSMVTAGITPPSSILHPPPSPTSGGLYTELAAHEWTLYLWKDCSIYSRGQTTQDTGWADTSQPGCNTSVAQGEDFPSLLMLPDCIHINLRSCPRKTNQTNGHFHYPHS